MIFLSPLIRDRLVPIFFGGLCFGPVIVAPLRAASDSEAGAPKVLSTAELLSPVATLPEVSFKGPETLQFTSSGNSSFRLTGEMPTKQVAVFLAPPEGVWDVSAFSYVRVDVTNRGPGLVYIRGRLDNQGALDWAKSARSQAFVMPGERATLGFPFPRAKDLNDSPPLFDLQSAKPNGHRDHWMKFDPSKVIGCRLVIQSTTTELQLDDLVISLAFPYGAKANARQLELPYLDQFGQVRLLDWPGKLQTEAELKHRHAEELAKAEKDRGPDSFNQYGGWKNGPQLEATGFFRVEKVNGKWWLVDPSGQLFFSHGANSVGFDQVTQIPGREAMFSWLPGADDPSMEGVIEQNKMRFMIANLVRTFGPSWEKPANDRLHRRYRQWGLNTIGAWSDADLMADQRTPFTPILHLGGKDSPLGNKIVDPFTEGFKETIKKGLHKLVPDPKNPWVVGVFIDNEIYWNKPFVQNAFLRGPQQPARLACLDWLKKKYGSIDQLNAAWGSSYADWDNIVDLPEIPPEDAAPAAPPPMLPANEAFLADLSELKRLIAGTYYRLCREAMREALPNHLYLGSRKHVAGREIYEEAAKYVDVISGNSYDTVAGGKSNQAGDKPCMETEFHFGAPDRGVPGVGLWPVGDQTQRSRAYVAYVLSALKHPKVVGTHWFAFPDQSAAARPVSPGGSSGENYQIGFVDVTDTPYPEITEASRALADRMYELANDPSSTLLESLETLWSEKPAEFSYRIEPPPTVSMTKKNGQSAVQGTSPFQLTLKPSEGDAWMMEHVRLLGLAVENTGAHDLVLDIMARNQGATTFAQSALGRTILHSGESIPLAVAFPRTSDYRGRHPAFLRMSGRPNGSFRHWHTIDPTRIQDLVITASSSGPISLVLGPLTPLQETDPTKTNLTPILDRFGQYLHQSWPGKVATEAEIKDLGQLEDDLIKKIGAASGFNQYGGWAEGPQLKATGFFRTEKVEGKWWFIDPEGRLFWSFGANCIGIDFAGQTPTEREPIIFQDLPNPEDPTFGKFHVKLEVEENFQARPNVPHYDFTAANLFRKYGPNWEEKQITRDLERLRYTHLNTIGAWSDTAIIERRKVPYVAMVHYVYPEAAPKLPDPFDPATRLSLRQALRDYPIDFSQDPWCLGAFVDNELHWKNDASQMIAAIFGHTRTNSAVRNVFLQWLQKKYPDLAAFNAAWKTGLTHWDELLHTADVTMFAGADPTDCAALATLFAETYARMVREELTAYAPKVLYLGCRMNAGSPEVITALANYADVISANIYSYRPELKQYGQTEKPVLISEFHFANVSGNNLGGGLRSAQDAEQQGRLLKQFIRDALRDPKLVGAHWFQWRDQNAAGRYDGENYDVGLFDIVDGPKPILVRAMAECGRSLYAHGR